MKAIGLQLEEFFLFKKIKVSATCHIFIVFPIMWRINYGISFILENHCGTFVLLFLCPLSLSWTHGFTSGNDFSSYAFNHFFLFHFIRLKLSRFHMIENNLASIFTSGNSLKKNEAAPAIMHTHLVLFLRFFFPSEQNVKFLVVDILLRKYFSHSYVTTDILFSAESLFLLNPE